MQEAKTVIEVLKGNEEAYVMAPISEIKAEVSLKNTNPEYFIIINGKRHRATEKGFNQIVKLSCGISKACKEVKKTGLSAKVN
jgi:predicted amidophosphoribosyltransferase